MPDLLLELEVILICVQDQPRTYVVRRLARDGNVDSLTKLKMKLTSNCRSKSDDFPVGEPYLRRKPKGKSAFSSLEERLANDIYELSNFLDTGYITSELKSMFKGDGSGGLAADTSTLEELEEFIDNSLHNTSSVNQIDNNNNTFTQTTGDCSSRRRRADDLATIEANVFIFKERVDSEMANLLDKLSNKEKIIAKHEEDLCKLREENLNFKSRLSKLEEQLFLLVESQGNRCKILYSEKVKESNGSNTRIRLNQSNQREGDNNISSTATFQPGSNHREENVSNKSSTEIPAIEDPAASLISHKTTKEM